MKKIVLTAVVLVLVFLSVRCVHYFQQANSIQFTLRKTLHVFNGSISDFAFSPSRPLAAVTAGKDIKIVNTDTFSIRSTLHGNTSDIWTLRVAPDGHTLASGGFDGSARLWDMKAGKKLHVWTLVDGLYVQTVDFSPDGKTLAFGGPLSALSIDGAARIWNVQTGKIQSVLAGHQGQLHFVAFSPDGSLLATGGDDKSVILWDVRHGKLLHRLIGHTETVVFMVFSADGRTLISGGFDGTVRIWDVQKGTLKRTLEPGFNTVQHIMFCRKGKSIVVTCDSGVTLYDIDEGSVRVRYMFSNAAAISPDGKTLAVFFQSFRKSFDFRDIETGALEGSLTTQCQSASPRFSPDGKVFAVFGDNGIVEIWDIHR